MWALGRFSGLAGRAESCPLLGAALAALGGAVAHLLGATSMMDVWICPGAGGVEAQVGGSSLGEMYEFSHARAGRAGLWGGLQQSKGKKEGRAGAEPLPGHWGCEEVHPGEAGSPVAMGWFPEVTLPWLSLSVWGFVEGTPFFPEAGAEGVGHWTHDHGILRGKSPSSPRHGESLESIKHREPGYCERTGPQEQLPRLLDLVLNEY